MVEEKLIAVADTDPCRCQTIHPNGQCHYRAVENGKTCLMHGGHSTVTSNETAKVRNYNFLRYRDRVNHFADSSGIKSLREEIGVLRMLLEDTINRCESDNDLMIYSSRIIELVSKIERVVISCHKLESAIGEMLDKSTIINISTQIVNIIAKYVNDEVVLDQIVDQISSTVLDAAVP